MNLKAKPVFYFVAVVAVFVSFGDILLLWNANAMVSGSNLPTPPDFTLVLGHYLGVLGIGFYGVGYVILALKLPSPSSLRQRILLLSGIAVGILGPVVHGLTTMTIVQSKLTGTVMSDPTSGILQSGALVLPLWIGILIVFVISSIACAASMPKRWMAVSNPLTLVIIIVVISMLVPGWTNFGAPASFNLAQIPFFALVAPRAVAS